MKYFLLIIFLFVSTSAFASEQISYEKTDAETIEKTIVTTDAKTEILKLKDLLEQKVNLIDEKERTVQEKANAISECDNRVVEIEKKIKEVDSLIAQLQTL